MGRPRFNESLRILKAATPEDMAGMTSAGLDPDLELSVCAMGPLEEGDRLLAMRVWVWQVADGQVAASSGTGGVHLGGHQPVASEAFPLSGADSDTWMIQTQLEPHSPQFVPDKPALATGMALVERATGIDIEHWSQAVMVKPRKTEPAGQHGEAHEEEHAHPPAPTT
jgi:hypothetical protein